jgi:hypothetical protein
MLCDCSAMLQVPRFYMLITWAMSRAKDDAGDGAHDGGGCQQLWMARTRRCWRGWVSKPPASLVVRLA